MAEYGTAQTAESGERWLSPIDQARYWLLQDAIQVAREAERALTRKFNEDMKYAQRRKEECERALGEFEKQHAGERTLDRRTLQAPDDFLMNRR